jgi:hypothetical protein
VTAHVSAATIATALSNDIIREYLVMRPTSWITTPHPLANPT